MEMKAAICAGRPPAPLTTRLTSLWRGAPGIGASRCAEHCIQTWMQTLQGVCVWGEGTTRPQCCRCTLTLFLRSSHLQRAHPNPMSNNCLPIINRGNLGMTWPQWRWLHSRCSEKVHCVNVLIQTQGFQNSSPIINSENGILFTFAAQVSHAFRIFGPMALTSAVRGTDYLYQPARVSNGPSTQLSLVARLDTPAGVFGNRSRHIPSRPLHSCLMIGLKSSNAPTVPTRVPNSRPWCIHPSIHHSRYPGNDTRRAFALRDVRNQCLRLFSQNRKNRNGCAELRREPPTRIIFHSPPAW